MRFYCNQHLLISVQKCRMATFTTKKLCRCMRKRLLNSVPNVVQPHTAYVQNIIICFVVVAANKRQRRIFVAELNANSTKYFADIMRSTINKRLTDIMVWEQHTHTRARPYSDMGTKKRKFHPNCSVYKVVCVCVWFPGVQRQRKKNYEKNCWANRIWQKSFA